MTDILFSRLYRFLEENETRPPFFRSPLPFFYYSIYIFIQFSRTQFWKQQRLNFTMHRAGTIEQTNTEQRRQGVEERVLNQSTNYRIHRHTHQGLPHLKPPTVLPVSSQALRFNSGSEHRTELLLFTVITSAHVYGGLRGEKITRRKLSLSKILIFRLISLKL